MTTLVWFRNDLRIEDHAPLTAALASEDPIVPVVCIDTNLARQRQLGVGRLGAHRAQFWMECVADLKEKLQSLGSDLVVLRGAPIDVLAGFASSVGAQRVFFHRAVAVDERTEERDLTRRMPKVEWKGYWGNLLVTPKIAPFDPANVPETFTAFRKKVEARVDIPSARRGPSEMPSLPANVSATSVPSLADFGLEPAEETSLATMAFKGGTTAALARLRDYIWTEDRLRVYKETRNGLLESNDSSRLSPWLAHGALSPRQVLDQVRAYERERVANDSTYWLVFELLWRDYFQFIALKHGARLFKIEGLRGLKLPWQRNVSHFEAWCAGQTGFPLIDASMRELAATGFTSNRARQNVASFFTKVLGIDWRIGAAWFEQRLIDYDPASNWGNWAYNAGVGNDARGFRYFHIPKQTRDYDPEGAFIRHWLLELSALPTEHLAEPHRAPADIQEKIGLGRTYPHPIVNLEAAVSAQRKAYERADSSSASSSNRRGRDRGRRRR
ncbi:MAG: DASH family cryptochrome [Myxococcota bacterium]